MVTKKKVGTVTPDECGEIKYLFERRNGLVELSKILTAYNKELYDKLVMDLGETSTKFQNWWTEKSVKYGWEAAMNGNWEVDFDTCDIYLVVDE